MEHERLTALFKSVQACFPKPLNTGDSLIVGINLMTFYVFTGPFSEAPARFQIMLQHLEAAMQAAGVDAEMQAKINAKLAGVAQQTSH